MAFLRWSLCSARRWRWRARICSPPGWRRTLYDLAFALLLGDILADVAQLRPQAASLSLALPSFMLPFAFGLATAVWLLGETEATRCVDLGLLFAMTAILVLFLTLANPDFPPSAERRQLLMQAAIVMDLACCSLFALGDRSWRLAPVKSAPLGLS